MARTRFTEMRAALTCTNEARDHERPSIGVDASGDRHRSLDRAAHHDSKHVPMRRPLPSHKPLFGTYFRAVAMRLVRCGCRGRLAPTVLRGSPTAEGKTAQGSLKRLSVASSGDPRVTKARDGSVQPVAVRAGNGGANIDRMGRILANALRVASVPVGVGIGFWTAQLKSLQPCAPYMRCPTPSVLVLQPTFATWQCALFGAGATVVVLLFSLAVTRLRSSS